MNQFEIKSSISIPYFDHSGGFLKKILNSAKRRGMNPWFFLLKKIINICLFRISFFCPSNSFRIKCHKWRGVNIGGNVYIGTQCSIDNAYPEYVYIEDNVSIASECLIIAHSNPYSHFQYVTPAQVAPVIIKQGAWICVRSVILSGVTIGENAVISAGSLISSDVPARSVASGNPAQIIARNLPVN
jgi:acetyltransferase-like isoleucine patch superfamily enzyme